MQIVKILESLFPKLDMAAFDSFLSVIASLKLNRKSSEQCTFEQNLQQGVQSTIRQDNQQFAFPRSIQDQWRNS
jgi:hypothetical protein